MKSLLNNKTSHYKRQNYFDMGFTGYILWYNMETVRTLFWYVIQPPQFTSPRLRGEQGVCAHRTGVGTAKQLTCSFNWLFTKLPREGVLGSSLNDRIHMFQGRSVRIRIIKQKEQRYERNKRQKHRTALRGNSVITEFACVYFPHAYILHSKRGGETQQTSLTWYKQ